MKVERFLKTIVGANEDYEIARGTPKGGCIQILLGIMSMYNLLKFSLTLVALKFKNREVIVFKYF